VGFDPPEEIEHPHRGSEGRRPIALHVGAQLGKEAADAQVLDGDAAHPADDDGADPRDDPKRPGPALHPWIISPPRSRSPSRKAALGLLVL
jgi:hypothetical protein